MFGIKRPLSSDCLDRPQPKLSKEDALSIYEATLQKLRVGSRSVSKSKQAASNIEPQGSTSGGAVFSASGSVLVEGLPQISESNIAEGSSFLYSTQSQGGSCSDSRSNNVVAWEPDPDEKEKALSFKVVNANAYKQ